MAVEDDPFCRTAVKKEVEEALFTCLPLHQLMVHRKDNVFITSLCTFGAQPFWHSSGLVLVVKSNSFVYINQIENK